MRGYVNLVVVVLVVILSVFTVGCNSNSNIEDGEMSAAIKKIKTL